MSSQTLDVAPAMSREEIVAVLEANVGRTVHVISRYGLDSRTYKTTRGTLHAVVEMGRLPSGTEVARFATLAMVRSYWTVQYTLDEIVRVEVAE